MRMLGVLIVLGVLFAACGGGGDDGERILRLGGGDITEAEFRTELRTSFLGSTGTETFCDRLKGLSDREVADVLVQLNRDRGVDRVQEPVRDDEERGAAIVKEECARIQ